MTKLLTLITTMLLAAVLMTAALSFGAEPEPQAPATGGGTAPQKVMKMRGTTQADRKGAAERNRVRLEAEAKKKQGQQVPDASPKSP